MKYLKKKGNILENSVISTPFEKVEISPEPLSQAGASF